MLETDMARVKITVLKTLDPKIIFGENVPLYPKTGRPYQVCSRFKEGQEFVVEEGGEMPAGFCTWAWNDLFRDVTVLRFGGNFPWMAEEGKAITCCTDGVRPVSFRLERL